MDFEWAPELLDLFARVKAFAQARLGAAVKDNEDSPSFEERWRALGELGALGLPVPESYGGLGLDALTTAGVIEALGSGCEDGGLLFSACAHLFACAVPIAHHGSEALKLSFLPRLCSGEFCGANAITEPEAGSDVFSLRASAVRRGDKYILNGTKIYVTNGTRCDVMVVYASTTPAHGYLGISAFVVERGAPGLRIGEELLKMGLRSSPLATVYLEDCEVPAENLLGCEGDGHAIFNTSMAWERACLFAAYLGSMQRQLDRTLEFSKARRQHRKPISKNQAISHRLADMTLRLASSRLLLYRACWLHDRGRPEAVIAISLAKLAVSEAAVQSGLDAIQIHGGLGVMLETGVGDALLDALPSRIFSGTSEIHRDIIARELGL